MSLTPSLSLYLYSMCAVSLKPFPFPSSYSSVPFLLVTSVQSDYSHKMTPPKSSPASLPLILKCMLGVSHIALPAGLVTVIRWGLKRTLLQMWPFKKTLLAVLNFTALLIEYSFSRHLYSSIEVPKPLTNKICCFYP